MSKTGPQILETLIRSLSELSIIDFDKQKSRDHNRLVRQLLQLHVQECNLPHLINLAEVPKYRADLDSDIAKETPALCLIKLCCDVGDNQRAIRIVLNRALGIPKTIDADYLFDQLSPFIKSLRSHLEKQTPPQDLSVQPYLGFINDVISALKGFLKDKPKHYEEIQASISRSSSWMDDAVRKNQPLIQANRWSISMEKAKALWRGIGSEDVLRRVVGDNFSEMETLLQEKTPIVPDSPMNTTARCTYSSSPFPPTSATSSSSNRPVKRTLSGNTAPATQTPSKKKKGQRT